MTVTYSLSVADTKLCGFAKLLFRWKGSIYKLMYKELIIFMILYYGLSLLYRYGLNENNKLIFIEICTYCQSFTKFIPLSFVLGFYVTIVVTRWWDSFKCIPWPDKCMMLVSNHLQGTDDRSRMMRRTIARYLVLLLTLTLQAISSSVKKRFPTVDHLQEAGLLNNAERLAFEKIPDTHGRWWVPAQWCACILTRARKEKRIKHDILLNQVLDCLFEYRGNVGFLWVYDWISIPLVYTQTVTIATYVYFCAALMARQYVEASSTTNHSIDSYVPIFTIMEFLCYMGWLKVAEQLINPFGEDDDDFELNYILDRNLFIGLYVADEMHNQFPILVKDSYWNEEEPTLPYTKSSLNLRSKAHLGSAVNLFVTEEDSEFVPLEPIMEDEKDDYVLNDINDNVTPEVNGYAFNYNMAKSAKSVSTAGIRAPGTISKFGSRIFNMLTGQSSENVNKNLNDERYMYYNSKKNAQQRQQSDTQSVQASQTSASFLQMPMRFARFTNRNKKINVSRSNTTSTNNSMNKLSRMRQRKRSVGTGSLGMKNAGSSTAISRISNDDLNSLQSEALSFGNYKSSPIAYRKYSFRGQTPGPNDQQSLINFEKFPELAQLNQLNSISSSADSSTNQPVFPAYLQGGHTNADTTNSRFSIYKSQQPSPQPHHLVSQLNQKLAQLERNNQYNAYNSSNYPSNYLPNYPNNYPTTYPNSYQPIGNQQPDDTQSTVSTISGLQMNILPPHRIERSNSRASEIKVTIEDDRPSPPPSQPTAIFNINDTLTSTKENTNLAAMSIPAPLGIKIDNSEAQNIESQEKINKEQTFDTQPAKDVKDQLVTIVEEEKTDSPTSSQSDVTTEKPVTTVKIQEPKSDDNSKKKRKERHLDKKLSIDSIYEPTSSQESLSPFQSNQNTVTSFADWINKTEEKDRNDDN